MMDDIMSKWGMQVHVIQVSPSYYRAISKGITSFLVEKTENNFQIGDWIFLEQYDSRMCKHPASIALRVEVTYVMNGLPGVEKGFSIVCFKK